MEIFDAMRANLLSPAVLFFALGLIAALVKSDLKFPEPLYATHCKKWASALGSVRACLLHPLGDFLVAEGGEAGVGVEAMRGEEFGEVAQGAGGFDDCGQRPAVDVSLRVGGEKCAPIG